MIDSLPISALYCFFGLVYSDCQHPYHLFLSGAALIPFLGKKSDKNDASEETSKLERFKQEADVLYGVYLIENAYNVLRRSVIGHVASRSLF